MKKLIMAVFVTAFLLAFATLSASAADLRDGDFKYIVNADGTATITGTTKDSGKLNIPSTVGGYKVTAIGKCWPPISMTTAKPMPTT